MGSNGGKYSRKKYIRALESLANKHFDKFKLESATKEFYKIKWLTGDAQRTYPIAANHGGISEGIAREIGKLFEEHGVCTKEEFIEMIK
jgi:hypothetical protein